VQKSGKTGHLQFLNYTNILQLVIDLGSTKLLRTDGVLFRRRY